MNNNGVVAIKLEPSLYEEASALAIREGHDIELLVRDALIANWPSLV